MTEHERQVSEEEEVTVKADTKNKVGQLDRTNMNGKSLREGIKNKIDFF